MGDLEFGMHVIAKRVMVARTSLAERGAGGRGGWGTGQGWGRGPGPQVRASGTRTLGIEPSGSNPRDRTRCARGGGHGTRRMPGRLAVVSPTGVGTYLIVLLSYCPPTVQRGRSLLGVKNDLGPIDSK